MDLDESSRSSTATTTTTNFDDNAKTIFTERPYQVEIMEQAKSENLIVCLPTGSGKTFIAVMLFKEWSPITRKSFTDGGKRTILLTTTVELARQHYTTMKCHIDDSKISIHAGSSGIRLQNTERWKKEFEDHSILIFTAKIFLNLLAHNIISLNEVNLLIFDECHHATGNDTYAMIMRDHYSSCRNCPRILGLTASISGQKIGIDQLEKVAKDLENILHARIETGSDRTEIVSNSTCVKVEHQRCFTYERNLSREQKMTIVYKKIKSLCDELDKKKTNKNESGNSPSHLSQSRTLDQLKSHLDNILHIGYDLGPYGLSLGIKSLRKHFQSRNAFIIMVNPIEKVLYEKILNQLDDFIKNDLEELPTNRFSDKVLKLVERIRGNQSGQTIVFVERVYTARFLCQILNELFDNSMVIKYLAGSRTGIEDGIFSGNSQRQVAEEFRENQIQVLISTAIIEEGLDVAKCNLVIRFNKPQNFSSYVQSKGRARAKEGKALFVLFRDENDLESSIKNKEEYEHYEHMEKTLKRYFTTNCFAESSPPNDGLFLLKPYRPGNGVKIDGIYAVSIIYQYCAVVDSNQVLAPRFCFNYNNQSGKYQCTLSMPGNCPIREDVICENKNKRIAKQECCLIMIEKLHRAKELDDRCLPIRFDRSEGMGDNSDDGEPEKIPVQLIDKQIAHFPVHPSAQWYLYKIYISNDEGLGFVVPCEQIKLPLFKLYGTDCDFTVEVVYLRAIDVEQNKEQLKIFCRYIFEDIFVHMNTGEESILKFDIDHSTFQLLPCLLTQSGEIDWQRMTSICDRRNKVIRNPAELNDEEVYMHTDLQGKQFYTYISDPSLSKRASDPWPHKRKLESIVTYADHFEYQMRGIHIERDFPMATLKSFKKPRISYLKGSSSETDSTSPCAKLDYYPIELLHYAPLNQIDFQLIYKLPNILTRILQLSYIEQLRELLLNNIDPALLVKNERIPTVTFCDRLHDIFSSNQPPALPLISLNYNLLSRNNCQIRLSPDLIFQSITRRSTAEQTDMENLEILGDCFLKLAMALSLYHQYPHENSGKLTGRKDGLVSNKYLYRLATEKELRTYLSTHKVEYGKKVANWLPPGYTTDSEHSDQYLKQKAKQKAFADMIEALIGAFLISTDYFTTIKFMDWLGLHTIPKDKDGQIMPTPSILYPGRSDTTTEFEKEIEQFYLDQAFSDVEKSMNYTFQNKAYLIAAFTHPSYSNNNRLTDCYDRLEFLGDAVLDFLVVRCIFVEHYQLVKPGRVTDIRQDLSNNGRLAYLLVSRKLHTKILHISPDLFYRMEDYLKDETIFPAQNSSIIINDINQWADGTAPKALADVFEALVGAIYLDSGYSLDIVWKAIEPLLRAYIDQSIKHTNLSPIRSFDFAQGEILREYKDNDGYSICEVKFPTGETFAGRKKNRKLAKFDACRKAMNSLER